MIDTKNQSDQLAEENAVERKALEACGGFDAYQQLLREAIIQRAKSMTIEDLINLDAVLTPEDRTDGLEQGFAGLIFGLCRKPLTGENIGNLEMPLGIERTSVLYPILERHLTIGKASDPIGLMIDQSGQGMDRRSAEFMRLVSAASAASDAEITRRKDETRKAMAAAGLAESAG